MHDEAREIRRLLNGLSRQVGRLTQLERIRCGGLLSLDEASVYTGYSKGYLYRLVERGILPCHRPTQRRVFVEKEALDDWIRGKIKD